MWDPFVVYRHARCLPKGSNSDISLTTISQPVTICLLSAYTSGDCFPLCAALHSEQNVSIYPPVLVFSIVRVYYRLACFFCFVSALLCLFPLDWVFLTSLSGGIVFSDQFLQFVPRGGSFLFPFFPPVQQTTDRIGNRIFCFLGGLLIIRLRPDRLM